MSTGKYQPSSFTDYKDLVEQFDGKQTKAYDLITLSLERDDMFAFQDEIELSDEDLKTVVARAVANGWGPRDFEAVQDPEDIYFTLALASDPEMDNKTLSDLRTRDYGLYENHERAYMAKLLTKYDLLPKPIVERIADPIYENIERYDLARSTAVFDSRDELKDHYASLADMYDHGISFNGSYISHEKMMSIIGQHERYKEMQLSDLSTDLLDHMMKQGYSQDDIDRVEKLAADHVDVDAYEEPDTSLIKALHSAVMSNESAKDRWQLQGNQKIDLVDKIDIDDVIQTYNAFDRPMDYHKQAGSINAAYHMGLTSEQITQHAFGHDQDAYDETQKIYAYAAIALGLPAEDVEFCMNMDPPKDWADRMNMVSQAIDAFSSGVTVDEIDPFVQADALKYFKVQADQNIARSMRDYEKYMGQMIIGLNDGLTPEQVCLYADPSIPPDKREAALQDLSCYAPERWEDEIGTDLDDR